MLITRLCGKIVIFAKNNKIEIIAKMKNTISKRCPKTNKILF